MLVTVKYKREFSACQLEWFDKVAGAIINENIYACLYTVSLSRGDQLLPVISVY